MQSFFAFLGRALLSLIFIVAAVHKFFDWQATEQYLHLALSNWLSLTLDSPTLQGLIEWTLDHQFLVLVVGVFAELIGGLLLFLGLGTRLGAFLLLMVCAFATLIFHHFWNLQEPQRQLEIMNFMKNLSIMGGLLFVLARGKGDCAPRKMDSEE